MRKYDDVHRRGKNLIEPAKPGELTRGFFFSFPFAPIPWSPQALRCIIAEWWVFESMFCFLLGPISCIILLYHRPFSSSGPSFNCAIQGTKRAGPRQNLPIPENTIHLQKALLQRISHVSSILLSALSSILVRCCHGGAAEHLRYSNSLSPHY